MASSNNNTNMPPPDYTIDDMYTYLLCDRFEEKVCKDYIIRLSRKIKTRERLLADTLVNRNANRINNLCGRSKNFN